MALLLGHVQLHTGSQPAMFHIHVLVRIALTIGNTNTMTGSNS